MFSTTWFPHRLRAFTKGVEMQNRSPWLAALALAGMFVSAQAAPQKAIFASDVSTVQWPLADLDPGLPENWQDFEFLVVEFRSEADFTVEKLRKYLVIGSPKECIEQIQMWTEAAGADYLIMRFRLPMGPSPEQVLGCIRQFGAEVIPHFRDA